MSGARPNSSRRILVVDDNPAIHEDFKKILGERSTISVRLDSMEALLFGAGDSSEGDRQYQVDSAYQGTEALAQVREALREDQPYDLAFVDMRMPPGWNGVETLEHLWKCDPHLNLVLCTAYSEQSWSDIARRFGNSARLQFLQKPFDPDRVLELAESLVRIRPD